MDGAAREEQFASFVSAALPKLLRCGQVLTGSRPAAEDLVQTALLGTLRAWRRPAVIEDPAAYTRRVMVNSYSSWWRRRGRWEVTGVVGSDYARPESISPPADAGLVDRDALWRALAGLPRQQRAVLVLRYYEDLSERDIAAILGVSTGTVKSQASRALRRLAEVVGGDFELPAAAGSPFPRQENPR